MRERQGHLNSRERDWQSERERERGCSKRDKERQINEREGECERES